MILANHGIIQSIQRIVTDGLVLYLDAGNPLSYPGTGTTWTDLSGNGKNATLVNGVSYSSNNSGVLSLDGVDDYIALDSSLSIATNAAFSVEICFYISSFANTYPMIFQIKTNLSYGYQIGFTNFAPNFNGYAGIIFGGYSYANPSWEQFHTNEQMVVNTWNHIVITYNGAGQNSSANFTIYRNNVSKSVIDSNDFGEILNNNYMGTLNANGYFFNGKLPIARIYNRVLSAAEVEQNFNVTKDRYGL
jgi:hypothetical protein